MIYVLPHMRIRALRGAQNLDEVQQYTPVPMGEFFSPRATDSMAVAYGCVDDAPLPRLVSGGAKYLIEERGRQVYLRYVLLDMDNVDHARWESDQCAEETLWNLYDKLPEHLQETAGAYTTPSGLRFMWRLDPEQPVPLSHANSLIRAIGEQVEAATEWEVDTASYEWQRLFRLPRSKREDSTGKPRVLQPPVAEAPEGMLRWWEHYTTTDCPLRSATVTTIPQGEVPEDMPERARCSVPWVRLELPIPGNARGSRYEVLRGATYKIALANPAYTAETIYHMVLPSTLKSPGKTREDAWSLAASAFDKAELARAEQPKPEPKPEPEPEPEPEPKSTIPDRPRPKYVDYSVDDSKIWADICSGTRISKTLANHAMQRDHKSRLGADEVSQILKHLKDHALVYCVLCRAMQGVNTVTEDAVWTVVSTEQRKLDRQAAACRSLAAFSKDYPLVVHLPGSGTMYYCLSTAVTDAYQYEVVDDVTWLYAVDNYIEPGLPALMEERDQALETLRNGKRPVLLNDYGAVVERVLRQSGAPRARVVDRTLEIPCHRMDSRAKPQYHADVAEWLRLLGGDSHEKLLDWLSLITYTSEHRLAAIYLHAQGGVGKNLLADGCSSLWGSPPADYNVVIGNSSGGVASQSVLLSTPVIHAEEGIKDRSASSADKFRQVVTAQALSIRELNRPAEWVHGCWRLIVSANNTRALPFNNLELTEEDMSAIISRVLYIRPHPDTKAFIEKMSAQGTLCNWSPMGGKPGYIAEHLLWLRDNHGPVVPGKRLTVEGEESEWHREFLLTGYRPRRVLDWLLQVAQDTDGRTVRWEDGEQEMLVDFAKALNTSRDVVKNSERTWFREELVKFSGREKQERKMAGTLTKVYVVPRQCFVDAGVLYEEEE